jgi:hypothetical protein
MKVNEHVKTTILEDIDKRRTLRTITKKYNFSLQTKPDDLARFDVSLLLSDNPYYWSIVYSNLFEFRVDKLYVLLDWLIRIQKVFTPFDLENFRVQFTLCLASYLQCSVSINDNNDVYHALNFLQFKNDDNPPPKQYGIFSPIKPFKYLIKKDADLLQRKLFSGVNPSIPDGEYVQWNGTIETLISWLTCCRITKKLHIGKNKIKSHKRKSKKYQDEDDSKYDAPIFLTLIKNHFSLPREKSIPTNWRDFDKLYIYFINISEQIGKERKTAGLITKQELLRYIDERSLKAATNMRDDRIKDIISVCEYIPE